MVEYALSLDSVFGALADMTRRDILQRLVGSELSVGEIARPYDLTLAAVSKHLKVLERARLIIKHRHGKEQLVQLSPLALKDVNDYLNFYRQLWERNLDNLEAYINREP